MSARSKDVRWYWCAKNAVWSRRPCKHAKCTPHPQANTTDAQARPEPLSKRPKRSVARPRRRKPPTD